MLPTAVILISGTGIAGEKDFLYGDIMSKIKPSTDFLLSLALSAICCAAVYFSLKHAGIAVLAGGAGSPTLFSVILNGITALMILISLILVLLYFWEENETGFVGLLFTLSFMVYFFWNTYAKTAPVSDYKVLIDGANSILDGDFLRLSSDKSNYFYFYNTQIPYTAFLSLMSLCTGRSLEGLKFIECLIQAVTVVAVYLTAKKISDAKTGIIASSVYMWLTFNILGSSVINNQHIAVLLCLAGMLYFFGKDIKSHLISGMFFALAVLMRQSSIIIVISAVCYEFYTYLFGKVDIVKSINTLKRLSLVGVSCIITFSIVTTTLVTLGIAPDNPGKAHLPYFKLLLGTAGGSLYGNKTIDAKRTQVYLDLQDINYNYEKYNAESLEAIKKAFLDTDTLIPRVKNNIKRFLGAWDNQFEYSVTEATEVVSKLVYTGVFQYNFILVLSAAAVFIRKKPEKFYLPIIAFLGYAVIHAFIEVQARYRFEIYAILAICSAVTVSGFLKKQLFVNREEQ